MRNASIVMLVVAAILGGVAVLGVRALVLSSARQTAQLQPEQPTVMSTVVVANTFVEFGAVITPEMLREIPWAAPDHPAGTFRTISEILNGERRVALRAIAPGQLILTDRISGTGGRATLSQFLGVGMRAVSLHVNEVSGAAGFILPGDYVDVMLTVDADRDPRQAATYVILQNVRVLAIDQIADERRGGAFVAKVATLEVTIEDGQRIALASSVGNISLALRNVMHAAEGFNEAVRAIRFSDLEPNRLNGSAPAPRNSPYTNMVVTRGVVSSNENVIRDGMTIRSVSTRPVNAGGTP